MKRLALCLLLICLYSSSYGCLGAQQQQPDIKEVARAAKLSQTDLGRERDERKYTVGNPWSDIAWNQWEANVWSMIELERQGVIRVDTASETEGRTAADELRELAKSEELIEFLKGRLASDELQRETLMDRIAVPALNVLRELELEKLNTPQELFPLNYSATLEAKYLRRMYTSAGISREDTEMKILRAAGTEGGRSTSMQRSYVLLAAIAEAKRNYSKTVLSYSDELPYRRSDLMEEHQQEINEWLDAPFEEPDEEIEHLANFPLDAVAGTMDYAMKNYKRSSLEQHSIQERVRKLNPLPKSLQSIESVDTMRQELRMADIYRNYVAKLQNAYIRGAMTMQQYDEQKQDLKEYLNDQDGKFEQIIQSTEYPSAFDWASMGPGSDDKGLMHRSLEAQKTDRKERMEKLHMEQQRQTYESQQRMKAQSEAAKQKHSLEHEPKMSLHEEINQELELLRGTPEFAQEISTEKEQMERQLSDDIDEGMKKLRKLLEGN